MNTELRFENRMKCWGFLCWITAAVCALSGVAAAATDSEYQSKKLNPYHVKKLREDIQRCATEVLACADTESRCERQQVLCKKLVQAEEYDKALKVAQTIYETQTINPERRAAHHYLIAEIYARKMKASPTVTHMEQNRRNALSATADVLRQGYAQEWGITEHARRLEQELQDPSAMSAVRTGVQKRQSNGVDQGKEAMANAQRAYMDAARGTNMSAQRPAQTQPKKKEVIAQKPAASIENDSSKSREKPANTGRSKQTQTAADPSAASSVSQALLASTPTITRSLTKTHPSTGSTQTFTQAAVASGLKPGTPRTTTFASNRSLFTGQDRAPMLIDGMSISQRPLPNSSDQEIIERAAKSGYASPRLDGGAASPSSTYATGQIPTRQSSIR